MRINNNMLAQNTHRQMGITGTNQSKSMEKLSSGLRINKAGDDAAGLAISEKMRGQIRGLNMASKNSQDGISMIQTAEGALSETHEILQRMRELGVQSSNDTNVAVDRGEIQKEMDELAKEVTRISNNTEFNTQKLINGGIKDDGIKSAKFHVGANANQDVTLEIKAMDAKSLGVSRDKLDASLATGAVDVTSVEVATTAGTSVKAGAALVLSATDVAAKTEWTAAATGITGTVLTSTDNSSQYNDYKITTTKVGATSASIDHDNKTISLNIKTGGADTAANIQQALDDAGIKLTATGPATATTATAKVAATTAGLGDDEVKLTLDGESIIVKDDAATAKFTGTKTKGITLKLDGSVDASTAATIKISKDVAKAATFGNGEVASEATTGAGIDVSTQAAASKSITTIQNAIETVSAERSKLGSYTNRLEHTIKNLDTSAENLQSAESRIRDVDMAKEMMSLSKNNILQQAAQAMMAQANNAPQGVLQLLR